MALKSMQMSKKLTICLMTSNTKSSHNIKRRVFIFDIMYAYGVLMTKMSRAPNMKLMLKAKVN